VRQLKNVLQRFSLLQSYGVTLSKVMDEEFGEVPLPPKEAGIVAPHKTGAPEHLMAGGFRNFEFAYEKVSERARRYSASPEWNLICTELAKNEGNRSVTAQKLGISRGCLNYQIKKHSS
jgi:DNA-binding NtrC family response regulator